MATTRTFVRIQDKGQVRLPAAIKKQLGLKKSDQVAVEATREGVPITPRGVAALDALTKIGDELKQQGVTLDDMIESGRAIREELYREHYGHLEIDAS